MRVVVTSFGSDGDFNPVLAVAAALVRRGVEVAFVANPFYERRVIATGSQFVAAGKPLDLFKVLESKPQYLRPGAGIVALWKDLVAPSISETYPVVRETVRETRATAVVSHVLSFGGAWGAAANPGVRSVIVTTTTSGWLSRYQPLVFAKWRASHRVQGALTVGMRGVGTLVLSQTARRLAARIGAPIVPDVVRAADLNLGIWPDWFRPPAPDDPPRSRLCGFVFAPPAAAPLSPELESFLASGEPPVVAAFGSAASLHAVERYRAVATACERLGRRCLLIGASARHVTGGPNSLTVPSAPYSRIFPAAALVVHHGGFGTNAETLRAGAPSVVTPFAFDQFDTAARVHDAGMGRWLIDDATRADVMVGAIDAALSAPSLRTTAAAAAQKIAEATDGAASAAALIEAL